MFSGVNHVFIFNFARRNLCFQGDDVGGLQAFGTLLDFEFDLLVLLERTITFHCDGREVDKYVRATLTTDETIPLGSVEPFYGPNKAFSHSYTLHTKLKNLKLDADS